MSQKKYTSYSISGLYNYLLIPLTLFFTGACVLIIELLAIRILSPYFGNTIFTFSSVISVVLAALSLGYYLGGKLADKHPSKHLFNLFIAVSGLLVVIVATIKDAFLLVFAANTSFFVGPLLSAVVLFFMPALLLGFLSPFGIKLQHIKYKDVGLGTISGEIFFWSTIGSIFGSLFTGYFLIPNFGVTESILCVGLALVCLGAIPNILNYSKQKSNESIYIIVFALVTLGTPFTQNNYPSNLVFETDGVYEKLFVVDNLDENKRIPHRILMQDRTTSGGIFLDNKESMYDYPYGVDLYKNTQNTPQNALILGAGAYVIPNRLIETYPQITIDVVDIEPKLEEVAMEFFFLQETEQIQTFVTDGRYFVNNSQTKYDLIFSDVYSTIYTIPHHLTTVEFLQNAKNSLKPEGWMIINFIGSLDSNETNPALSQIKTFKTIFPNYAVLVPTSMADSRVKNILIIGIQSDENKVNIENLVTNPQDSVVGFSSIDVEELDFSKQIIFTDNFAPIEYLSKNALSNIN